MFSHMVKNYALLTYNGRLIVHGVALRSSRAEPFGDRFLRQALLCLRFYRTGPRSYTWLPEEADEAPAGEEWEEDAGQDGHKGNASSRHEIADRRDYDVEHYLQVLVTSYAARLRRAFEPEDFARLFRIDNQLSLFDRPVESVQPRWIRCQ
jgi:DNA polymerase, archaea type